MTMNHFAILCRVSTADQADEGQSLVVQQKTLRKCVEMLNGTLVKEYIGSESATAGEKERPILDEMLTDAQKKLFDALIVHDLSRLTRDPIKNKIILAALKKNGIRLYEQTREHDLNSPETVLYAGIMSEVNAFQIAIQVQKGIESKIELARRGWLVYGQPPFGRKLAHQDRSRPPEWILDPEKVGIAQKVYDLYINQRIYVDKIGKTLGLDDGLIYRILKDRGIHRQTFKVNNETLVIETPIPRLFTPEQSELIRERLKSNKVSNGAKQMYLLRGLVKCQVCGYIYLGFTSTDGKHSYYTHSKHKTLDGCLRSVHRKPLEKAVLDSIAELISNNQLLMDTVRQCNQNSIQRTQTLEQEINKLSARQEKAEKRKARIIKLIIDGVLDEEDITKEIEKVKKELNDITTELLAKRTELESLANTEVPEEVLARIKYTFDCLQERYGKNIGHWEPNVKRLLVEWFFGTSNKQSGVWIRGSDREVLYTIKSNLGTIAFGWLGDDTAAGVVGQEVMNEKISNPATLTQFASIVEGLNFNPNRHELRSARR